jgi:hypothetical protein
MDKNSLMVGALIGGALAITAGGAFAVANADELAGLLRVTVVTPDGSVVSDTMAGNNTTIIINDTGGPNATPPVEASVTATPTATVAPGQDGPVVTMVPVYVTVTPTPTTIPDATPTPTPTPTTEPTMTPTPTATPLPAGGHLSLSASGNSIMVRLVNTGSVALHPVWMTVSSNTPGSQPGNIVNHMDETCFGACQPGQSLQLHSGLPGRNTGYGPNTVTVIVYVEELGELCGDVYIPYTGPSTPPIVNGSGCSI